MSHQPTQSTGDQILLACPQYDTAGTLQEVLERLVVTMGEYAFFQTNLFRKQLLRFVKKAVNQVSIPVNLLKRVEIVFPKSLTDQKRIAKVLSNCEQLIAWRKESIQMLDIYLESVFLEMFGDPRVESKFHKYGTIKDLIGKVITGNTPPRKDPSNYGDFIEWIKTDNLDDKSKSISHAEEFLSEKGSKKARIVKSGSLLVTCIAGSLKSIGTCGLTDRTISFNQQINAIVPFNDINSDFLYSMFKLGKSYIQCHAKKGMKKILTKGEFEKIMFIKPEHDLQLKFSKISKKAEKLKLQLHQSLNEIECLYSSLSQKAFKGELNLNNVVVDEEMKHQQSSEETTKVSTEKEKPPSLKKVASKPKGKRDIRNLTLLNHLSVPEELYIDKIADDYGPELDFIEDDLFYQFYLKDNFPDQTFTFSDLQQKFNSYYIPKGQDFEPRTWKSILFKFMEGQQPLVKQIFEEASGTIKLKLTDEAFKA